MTTVADSTDVAFCGNRYVFGYIKTRTISLDTRVNWTFSPNLTLQLFVQPFIASGAYTSFREFAAPRTVKKLVYGKDIGTIARTPASGEWGRRTRSIRTARGRRRRSRSGIRTSRPVAARQRGAAVGVSAGVDGVLRVDAAANGV